MDDVAAARALRVSGARHASPAYQAPRPIAVWAFARYFRGLFRRHFASARWSALDDPTGWDHSVPVLFLSNHTNWWDGFFSCLLTAEWGFTFHILMEAGNLERYPAFRRIGTLPLRRDSRMGAWQDLHDADRALRAGSSLWIYPQGRRRPATEVPWRLERGAAHLAIRHSGPLRICPVAFRYSFMSEQLPEAIALAGVSWLHDGQDEDRSILTDRMGAALRDTVRALDARLSDEALDDFRILVPGRLSINKRMDRVRHSLGLLRGPFEARNG